MREASHTIRTPLSGAALLNTPLLNKGSAFSREERGLFGLDGLLPDHVSTIEEQVERIHASITQKADPLERFIGLAGLQDRNEHLFYRLLSEHVEEFLPIVYTPTVGLAAQRFSHIFRRPRGVWVTPDHRGRVAEILGNAAADDVRLIVVTDNERILGLGDLGAGGMAIPVGKLALYTLGAGIHPGRVLGVSLDVGTDNEELLADELYLGWRRPRLRGEAYDALVEEFVAAVEKLFPDALLQWEDFKKVNALTLLERYRSRLLSFNDDIQGTAAVALAGILAGVRATGVPLAQHRIVILGAGAAGIGIAGQVRAALVRAGLDDEEALAHLAVLDSRGLLTTERQYRAGEDYKREYGWSRALLEQHGLAASGSGSGAVFEDVVTSYRPTILVGTSGQPGIFSEEIVRAMAAATERPLIFPFSNPTSKSEARPADLIAWTDGRALTATGSPFDPVEHGGRTHRIGQGNNVFIFPGVGLGALTVAAREISDQIFTVAAETLAAAVTDEDLAEGALYPRLSNLRAVSRAIAVAVAAESVRSGLAPAVPNEELGDRVDAGMWEPIYPGLEPQP